MNENHVEHELVAYLDGELSAGARARVEGHLAGCPTCAAALEELRALSRDVDATLDAALTPVRLSYDADDRIRAVLLKRLERARYQRGRWWHALWQRRGVFAQAAMALVLVFFSINGYRVMTTPAPVPQETLVLGQERFAPGSEAALRVIVRSAESALPLAGAQVAVSLAKAPGLAHVVYEGVTGDDGTAEVAFTVPDDLDGAAALVVETRSDAGTGRIEHPVHIARAYKIYLASDKPAYRPGQTLHMRALVLDALDFKPVADQAVAFTVRDAAGQVVAQQTVVLSDYGIAACDVALPASAALGTYTLEARLGDTLSERAVDVDTYELPAFRVALETDRTFYAPGDRVEGTVEAAYFFGKPVAEGVVILRGGVYFPDAPATLELFGETDAQGRFDFAFDLPADFAAGQNGLFDLEVEVIDVAGQRAGLHQQLPVAPQPVVIRAVPESGRLKPGVENVVYVMTALADGAPVQTALTVTVGGQRYELESDAYGLAELRFVPSMGTTTLDVVAHTADGAEGTVSLRLQSDEIAQSLLLRAERATYEAGDTLRLEALLAGDAETVYLDVARAGQMVATLASPVDAGRAAFALDLDADLVGSLTLRAYMLLPDGALLADTRLVVVDAPRQLAVDVTADKTEYRPGAAAALRIQTKRTVVGGVPEPAQSALGIAVVDESVYALDTLPPSFARTYFLLDEALRVQSGRVAGLDVPALLAADAGIDAASTAQDVAAQAAWAGAPVQEYALRASDVVTADDGALQTKRELANQLGMVLAALPLIVSVLVARGLKPSGALRPALRRLGWGLLAGVVIAPLAVVGGLLGLLLPQFGAALAVVVLVLVVGLLLFVVVDGWRRHDARVQAVAALVGGYLILGGLLTVLAAQGPGVAGWLLVLVVATFLLLVAALALLGQGLVVEGRRATGWVTTALAILLIFLAVTLPAVPALTSNLTRALGNPAIYVGPLGWMTGCGAAPEATEAPAVEEPAAEVEKTVEVEKVVEETEEPAVAVTAMPTAVPTATPASTPLPVPAEPYPLRHIFPESLYWAPEVLTDEAGVLAFEMPLADNITTWRLTALASTLEGDIGAATHDLVVFQDFFVELAVPDDVQVGEALTVTATIYNFLDEAQGVTVVPVPDAWYRSVVEPEALVVPAAEVVSVPVVIQPEESGAFTLRVDAEGARMGDAVAVEVVVGKRH